MLWWWLVFILGTVRIGTGATFRGVHVTFIVCSDLELRPSCGIVTKAPTLPIVYCTPFDLKVTQRRQAA